MRPSYMVRMDVWSSPLSSVDVRDDGVGAGKLGPAGGSPIHIILYVTYVFILANDSFDIRKGDGTTTSERRACGRRQETRLS